jgi:WD40 repeat protein
MLTVTQNFTAQLWDGLTGARLGQPMKHAHFIKSVAFSPDGARVVTGSRDNTARLWEVPPPALDDPERIWLSTEVRTGWTIENGSRRALTPEEHQAKKERLDALGGDCLNRTYNDLTETEKLELRTPLHIPTSAKTATSASSQP